MDVDRMLKAIEEIAFDTLKIDDLRTHTNGSVNYYGDIRFALIQAYQ